MHTLTLTQNQLYELNDAAHEVIKRMLRDGQDETEIKLRALPELWGAFKALHIALLACPVPAGSDVLAHVQGIGRFYMTAPASNGVLSAEFAGVVAEGSLAGPAELLR